MNPYELYTTLVAHSKIINYSFIELGKVLNDLKKDDNYKKAVGDTDTWQHFVKQPEINLSVSEANKLIDIYVNFVEELGYSEEQLAETTIKNLKILLPFAKDLPENFDEMFEQAKVLSDKDLKNALVESKEKLGESKRTYKYLVMKRCLETGNLTKVHDLPSEEIKTKLNIND